MSAAARPTLVAGLGKIGFQDDAVGLRVVQALKETPLPDHVELFEGPGASDLTELFAGRKHIIIVDTADFEGKTGQLIELEAPDLLADQTNVLRHIDIRKTFAVLYLHNRIPQRLTVFGVIPCATDPGSELTEEVKLQLAVIVRTIVERLTNNRS
jgi:hydrogenase maturation protease